MGSPCLFTRQRALKMGIFSGCELKIRITFIKSQGLVNRKTQSFILKVKLHLLTQAVLLHLFLVAWLREYCTFWDSSVVSLKSWPWPKYSHWGTIFAPKIMFYYLTFFLLQICSLLVCCQQVPEKKFGGHRACLREKENLFCYRAQLERNLFGFVRAPIHVSADDVKIVRSRDAQCNTKELP